MEVAKVMFHYIDPRKSGLRLQGNVMGLQALEGENGF
jgi:hypothetical protein